jgi:phosphatidylglycerophosphate synthase
MSPNGPIDSLDPAGSRTVRLMSSSDVASNWTSERLAELRRRSYGAAGWVDFLRQSLERSTEQRRRLADADRQLRRWMTAWAVAALGAGRVRRAPKVSLHAELGMLASTWLMIRWHLGMLHDGEATSRDRLSGADALTLTRLWLAPRLRRAAPDPPAFVAILLVGAATDVIDGRLARRSGTSRLGRDLDSLTDLVFFRAAGRAAREAGAIGQLPALAFELSEMLGPAYAGWHYFRFAGPPMIRSRASVRVAKATALVGIAAAVARRKGDLAVLSGSTAAVAVQVTSALRPCRPRS